MRCPRSIILKHNMCVRESVYILYSFSDAGQGKQPCAMFINLQCIFKCTNELNFPTISYFVCVSCARDVLNAFRRMKAT